MIVTLKAYATLTLHFVHFHIVSLAANSINIKHFPVSAERDLSPVRRRNRNSDDDLSPARKANRSGKFPIQTVAEEGLIDVFLQIGI